jgi:phospholipid transport system substrate-binding protein
MLKQLKSSLLKSLLLVGLAAPALAQSDSPVDLVRDTSRQVLDTLRKDNGSNTAKVREQVEALVLPKFDFKRMTALAVGMGWRQADPAQQTALTEQFQSLLVRSYTTTMTRFKNAQVEINPNPVYTSDGREAVVKSQVSLSNAASGGGNQPVEIDYTFYKTNQGWKVFNVAVEGASLITAYRNNFSEEIRKGGVDGLIKTLKAKNASFTNKSSGT